VAGQNQTPASGDSNPDYVIGPGGGRNAVTLTTAEIPAHNHTGATDITGLHTHAHEDDFSYVLTGWNSQFPGSYLSAVGTFSGQGTSEGASDRFAGRNKNTGAAGSHSHAVTINNTGGGLAHENRPPYYALAYIMKL
jgi:microcystin-dependent protein